MFIAEFLTIAVVHLLAVVSPGPDFVVVTRNSFIYSRVAGLFTAFGLGLGILVHVAYSLLGVAVIISQSVVLFNIIKYLGAAYLVYIGYKSLRAQPRGLVAETVHERSEIQLSPLAAIRVGFFTNVLNPKATLFFLALFTQVINPATPKYIQLLYGAEMIAMTVVWFSIVAVVFSSHRMKSKLHTVQHYIECATGAVLLALGIKVAFTAHN
jgi:RhtB (resistance to homoserine/threonine) family protein